MTWTWAENLPNLPPNVMVHSRLAGGTDTPMPAAPVNSAPPTLTVPPSISTRRGPLPQTDPMSDLAGPSHSGESAGHLWACTLEASYLIARSPTRRRARRVQIKRITAGPNFH